MKLENITTGKRYYIYFTCANCDVSYSIEAADDVDMELIGVAKFTCKKCGTQTEWLPHIIHKHNMPGLYDAS